MLGVSVSGYYEWLRRPLSARSLRHVWLTEQIRRVHAESRGTYGARRVHAELTIGRGILVGLQAVEALMRRACLQGISGRPRYRRVPNVADCCRPGSARVPAARTEPALGHRHHRAFDPRGEALLRGRARRVQPPRRRLVDRRASHGRARHERARHGDRAARSSHRRDRDPQRPGHAVHVVGVHATGDRLGPASVDGLQSATATTTR